MEKNQGKSWRDSHSWDFSHTEPEVMADNREGEDEHKAILEADWRMWRGFYRCVHCWIVLMKVLSHPGHGKSIVLYHRQLDLFQFLEDVSSLIQEASSVLTNWRRIGRLLNSVWECPHRVVKETCALWVSGSLEPLVGRLSNWPSGGFLRLGEPRSEWLLSCMGRELSTAL